MQSHQPHFVKFGQVTIPEIKLSKQMEMTANPQTIA
jgi:hypothetical protein